MLTIPADDRRQVQQYPLQETRLHQAGLFATRTFFRFFMVLEVSGEDRIPTSGGLVVAANHLTGFDMFPLQLALGRSLFFMAKAELFQNSAAAFFLRQLGAFPVYRGARDEWAIAHSQKLLETGQAVGIFPEGTRSWGGGLKVARSGAARIALAAQCPLLPVTIEGSQSLFQHFARRTHVRITICEPILPRPEELPLALTDRLMFTLARNLPPQLRGVYAEIPPGF